MSDFSSILHQTEKCLFCGKTRAWGSALACMRKARTILFLVTICPECRKKHTIYEMYQKTLEEMRQKAKEFVEGIEGKKL